VLRLYDTLTRQVEDAVPSGQRRLRMYSCGPTVYRDAHLGNLRTFLLGDLVARAASRHGVAVMQVQNITDVGHLEDDSELDARGEDKVAAEARRQGRSPLEIARSYEDAFHRDLAALNVRPAAAYPRASECVGLMLDLIARLVDQGHAYVGADGSVFFDARSFPSYGALSGNRLDELRPGHRFAGATDERKRFHADWALWKAAGPARELVWESPWGRGFPGWHVECSAMSLEFLDGVVDVHTGGIDLRFPHHEDERAQSNAAVAREVVRRWVHGEHVLFAGRKMAKSTGNVVLLGDVIARGFDPLAVRLAFLEHRYRQQLNLTWETIAAAHRTLDRWRAKVAEWAQSPSKPMCAEYVEHFWAAVDDDLDTAGALHVLRRLERDGGLPAGAKFETFAHVDQLLGLDLAREVGRPPPAVPLPEGAAELLSARAAAREAADWAASDRLRAELAALGVHVADAREGQTWTVDDR